MSAKELGPVWTRVESEELKWPENGKPCKEVFQNMVTGEKIIRRFNQLGTLIFSNEDKYFRRPQMI